MAVGHPWAPAELLLEVWQPRSLQNRVVCLAADGIGGVSPGFWQALSKELLLSSPECTKWFEAYHLLQSQWTGTAFTWLWLCHLLGAELNTANSRTAGWWMRKTLAQNSLSLKPRWCVLVTFPSTEQEAGKNRLRNHVIWCNYDIIIIYMWLPILSTILYIITNIGCTMLYSQKTIETEQNQAESVASPGTKSHNYVSWVHHRGWINRCWVNCEHITSQSGWNLWIWRRLSSSCELLGLRALLASRCLSEKCRLFLHHFWDELP